MKRADLTSTANVPIAGFVRARLMRVTNRLAVFTFVVVAAGMFSQKVFAQNPCECWIDAKTGLPVPTVPYPLTVVDSTAANTTGSAIHPDTGQNFVRIPDGTWIDAKTGQCIPTVPYPLTVVDSTAANTTGSAIHPDTGQNFARVPCPPPEEPATAAPPGETHPHTGSPTASPATPVQQEPQPSGGVSVPSIGFGFGGFGHGSDRGGSKGDSR
ncbi:MAG: hypothetical protein ACLQME_07880 [Alphaproteobacteria bacterium]